MISFNVHADFRNLPKDIGAWFDERPKLYKAAVVANHLFRMFSMYAFMGALPFSPVVKAVVGLSSSLFYNVTIERFCQFRFAMPAFAGAVAFSMSKDALAQIVCGVALSSFKTFAGASLGAVPLIIYGAWVISIASENVDRYIEQRAFCCCP